MPSQIIIEPCCFLGKRTIIVGEVNLGKTSLTRRILEQVYHKAYNKRFAVIDMAPVISKETAARHGLSGIGGGLVMPEGFKGLYLSTRIDPPRLSSESEDAAVVVAERNRKKIEKLLQAFLESGRDILFVNDISLYLQAGSAQNLIYFFSGVTTLVANGYFGEKLGKGVLSRREHQEMKSLMGEFSKVIRLGSGFQYKILKQTDVKEE